MTLDNLVNHYTYDAEGRPVSAAGVTTTYDAFGRAVENSNGGGTQIVYSPTGWKFALMNGTSLIKYRVPMPGGMVATHNGDGTGYYQHADWLGSSRFATSAGVRYDRAYAPFGEVYAELNGNTENRTFTGPQEDTTPGIDDFLFRQYSASQGRWLVPDPAGMAAVDITNPQTWNRYAYLANNPLNAVDPKGLYCAVSNGQDLQACGDTGSGSYDASAGTGPGGVYAAASGPGFPGYGGQSGTDPCGGWCAPPPSLLGNLSASQDAFGEQLYGQWELQALLDLAVQQASTNQTAIANCIATGLQSTFGTSSVTVGTSTGEVGGHWNFNFQLTFSSNDDASTFTSVYNANLGGFQPGGRFGSGPALHVENPASSWSYDGGSYSLGVTAHLDLYNPNSGPGGFLGHVADDGIWGHIVQLFGGSIDPTNCPYH